MYRQVMVQNCTWVFLKEVMSLRNISWHRKMTLNWMHITTLEVWNSNQITRLRIVIRNKTRLVECEGVLNSVSCATHQAHARGWLLQLFRVRSRKFSQSSERTAFSLQTNDRLVALNPTQLRRSHPEITVLHSNFNWIRTPPHPLLRLQTWEIQLKPQ